MLAGRDNHRPIDRQMMFAAMDMIALDLPYTRIPELAYMMRERYPELENQLRQSGYSEESPSEVFIKDALEFKTGSSAREVFVDLLKSVGGAD